MAVSNNNEPSGTWVPRSSSARRRNELLRIKRATGSWSEEEYREFKMICKARRLHATKLRALGYTKARIDKVMR
jgi:hypothetical protein